MCGIFAYVGHQQCASIIYEGLKRLEYRGYDSAGIATLGEGVQIIKSVGVVAHLKSHVPTMKGTAGIGHTRWATHGPPTKINAHPHQSTSKTISIVHNGIIENHTYLRQELKTNGLSCISQTDSEVLAHLIEYEMKHTLSFSQAVRMALQKVQGTFGLVVMSTQHPQQLVVAKRGSPLVIGVGEHELFVSSDPSAIVEHTRKVIYLDDDTLALLTPESYFCTGIFDERKIANKIHTIDWDIAELEKGGHAHFMLKEMLEQPQAIQNALRGRIKKLLTTGGLNLGVDGCENYKRIVLTGCGTSWHAGLIAKHYFERLTQLPVEVDYASEFRYRDPRIGKDDLLIAISQSGETADTLEAVKLAKQKGACTLGIVNVIGSSIAREVSGGKYLHAGPEIGVASTKAFTTQLMVLLLVALHIGLKRGCVSDQELRELASEIDVLAQNCEIALQTHESLKKIAREYASSNNALYLGRGMHFPVALEGALKLKEISYIHAEGLPAAEMKHGPIALIDKGMPVVVLAPKGYLFEKILGTCEEVRARGGDIIAITTEHSDVLSHIAKHVIVVPSTHALLQPILSNIPLQLLAYELALVRGCDVDKPRNLAKSVTVE